MELYRICLILVAVISWTESHRSEKRQNRRYCGPLNFYYCFEDAATSRISRNYFHTPIYIVPPSPPRHSRMINHPPLVRVPRLVQDTSLINNKRVLSEKQQPNKHLSGKHYDPCLHPFHSWMCQNPGTKSFKKGSNINSNFVTTGRSIPKQLFSDSLNSGRLDFPEPATTTQRTTTTTTVIPNRKAQNSINFPDNSKPRKGSALFGEPIFPSTTQKPPTTYDKCSHPFHSWLCSKPKPATSRPSGRQLFPQETNKRKGSSLFSEPMQLKVSTPAPPTTTPAPKVTTPYDKCSHPFHSWLCRTTQPRKGKALQSLPSPSNTLPEKKKKQQGSALFSEPINVKPTTPKTKEYDSCSHAFHAWLCPTRRTKARDNFSQSLPAPAPKKGKALFSDPITTTPKSPKKSGSFNNPSIMTTTTTPKPPRRGSFIASQPSNLPSIKNIPKMVPKWEMTDPCNHAFHSWLCKQSPRKSQQRGGGKTLSSQQFPNVIQTTRSPPVITTKPSRRGSELFDQFITTPSPTTRLTSPVTSPVTTVAPRGSDLFPNNIINRKKPDSSSLSNTLVQPKPTPTYDKCSHPFHKWLCDYHLKETSVRIPFQSPKFTTKNNLPNFRNLPLETEASSLIYTYFPKISESVETNTKSSFKVFHEEKPRVERNLDKRPFQKVTMLTSKDQEPIERSKRENFNRNTFFNLNQRYLVVFNPNKQTDSSTLVLEYPSYSYEIT